MCEVLAESKFKDALSTVDSFVWGPAMLILLVGTGIFLTFKLHFMPWRNLFPSLKRLFSKESRKSDKGSGDISPFSALMTALAATIGTGNIVGVATAMATGGAGALVWMWIAAIFGITSKFAECAIAIKYREVNEDGEMSGGPMYAMKKGIKCKPLGSVLAILFAIFAVIASFGIGNLTQANSISDALNTTFSIPTWITGAVITILALAIILGGIKRISKISSVLVPVMAAFYIVCGIIVIIMNHENLGSGISMIFKMAFSVKAVGGGICGTITANIMNAMRFGVARGVFSNEAGMGSAAITAAAATTDHHVRQGYINMCGTFIDTIIVCTITGFVIASSGVLGSTNQVLSGSYVQNGNSVVITAKDADNKETTTTYKIDDDGKQLTLTNDNKKVTLDAIKETNDVQIEETSYSSDTLKGTMWKSDSGAKYIFEENGDYSYEEVVTGSALTIAAFETVLGKFGAVLVSVGLVLFAFSTILGWEYHGEKALEYIVKNKKIIILYRVFFSLISFVGATTALEIVWNFADIANALMAIPNLILLLMLSGELKKDVMEFKEIQKREKAEITK